MKWLWLGDGYVPGPHRQERILPTGECSLIFDLTGQCGAALSGPQSESFVIDVAAQFAVAGVQFAPGGAFSFFKAPLRDMLNQQIPLEALWGRLAGELGEHVDRADSPGRRLDAIERVLLAQVRPGRTQHPAVLYALRELEQGTTPMSVAEIVSQVGLSHRRFIDLFTSQVGLTPKRFGRVRRFQRLLHQVRRGERVDWADVALSCGYYDQAHFINEFVTFSGVNPSSYQAAGVVHANHVPI